MDRHVNTLVAVLLITLTFVASVAYTLAATDASLLPRALHYRARFNNMNQRNSTAGPLDGNPLPPAPLLRRSNAIDLHRAIQQIFVLPQRSFRSRTDLTTGNSTLRGAQGTETTPAE